jgi:hypothetical protein
VITFTQRPDGDKLNLKIEDEDIAVSEIAGSEIGAKIG